MKKSLQISKAARGKRYRPFGQSKRINELKEKIEAIIRAGKLHKPYMTQLKKKLHSLKYLYPEISERKLKS
jgi:hypothetical protein